MALWGGQHYTHFTGEETRQSHDSQRLCDLLSRTWHSWDSNTESRFLAPVPSALSGISVSLVFAQFCQGRSLGPSWAEFHTGLPVWVGTWRWGRGTSLPCLSLGHWTLRLSNLAAWGLVLSWIGGASVASMPRWLQNAARRKQMCGGSFLGIILVEAVAIKRAERHQPPWPWIWLHLRFLLLHPLALIPGVSAIGKYVCADSSSLAGRSQGWPEVPLLGGWLSTSHVFWERPKANIRLWRPNHCPKRLWSNTAQFSAGIGEQWGRGWLCESSLASWEDRPKGALREVAGKWVFAFYFYFKQSYPKRNLTDRWVLKK